VTARLLDAGHDVYGTDRTRSKAQPLIDRGLVWRDTPREVTAAVEAVFTMVTDDDAVRAITSGPDGILAGLTAGKVYIDMSTISPRTSREVAEQVRSTGAEMLDAPVSGSIPQAESGTLAVMVGGDEEAFRKVEPLLAAFGQPVTHIGANGQGLVLKLAINISLAVQVLAFSEGLLLAERDGVEPKLAAEVMAATPIGSPMLKARLPLLLDLPEQAWFDVAMMHKDIRLALEAADELGIGLPSTGAADAVLTKASDLGYAHRDLAALHEVLARSPGA
jgi:3-hydroxyisobutyrate dehydrogenase-like beta-hydroxyacid dehydrogenase